MDTKEYVQRLNEILVKKHDMLSEILSYTCLQKEAILQENYNELEILISRKQQRIEAVDKLDDQFSVYSSRLKSMLDIETLEDLPGFGIPGTADLKAYVAKILEILNEINKIEKENNSKVQTELTDLKGKIKQNNSFKQVNNAYSAPKGNLPSYYFDKKK